MITLINFSHPLSELAVEQVRERYAEGTELAVCRIKVQMDMKEDLGPQVQRIFREALGEVGGNARDVDMVILPGMSVAAVLLIRAFREATGGYVPHILVLVSSSKEGPPQFLPRQLVRGVAGW